MAGKIISMDIKTRYAGTPLIFAVPGSKVYINNYYTNTPGSFLNISVTGAKCYLLCKHCRGLLLKGMDYAETAEELIRLIGRFDDKNLQGILISGGFSKDGTLPLGSIPEAIHKIKTERPGLKILVHAGFVDDKTAAILKNSGTDGILTNLIGSRKAISGIYNLKGRQPDDYYRTIAILKKHGLKVSPHIILGIGSSGLEDEFGVIKNAISLGADSLVFIVIKKVSRKIPFDPPEIETGKFLELVNYARSLSPGIPLSFGCAKPSGAKTRELEKSLLKIGISAIAFPSEETVEYAVKNKIAHTFIEKCCAIL